MNNTIKITELDRPHLNPAIGTGGGMESSKTDMTIARTVMIDKKVNLELGFIVGFLLFNR